MDGVQRTVYIQRKDPPPRNGYHTTYHAPRAFGVRPFTLASVCSACLGAYFDRGAHKTQSLFEDMHEGALCGLVSPLPYEVVTSCRWGGRNPKNIGFDPPWGFVNAQVPTHS